MKTDERSRHVAGRDGESSALEGMMAELLLMVGKVGENTKPGRAKGPQIPFEACHPVPVLGNVPLTAGAGTLDQAANVYGPADPWYWDLRRLSCWGFTAGSVTVYLNSSGGEQLAVFPSAGQTTWSSNVFLAPRDHLVFVATGITGVVNFGGQAIEVKSEWLAEYLM